MSLFRVGERASGEGHSSSRHPQWRNQESQCGPAHNAPLYRCQLPKAILPESSRGREFLHEKLDGKGKGRLAAGRISLERLRFLASRWTPGAGASSRKLNDINVPSASILIKGFGIAFCTHEWYTDS